MTLPQTSVSGLVSQAVSIFVWQVGLIVQKTLTSDASVGAILLLQLGCAAIIMWGFLALSGQLPALTRRNALNVAWGILAPGMVLALGIMGAARTDGVSIALIWGILPVLGPLLARLFLKEHLNWTFPVGGLVAFTGLILLTLSRQALGASDMRGNILVFLGVLCSSLSQVIGRKMNTGSVPWYQVATLQVTGALVTISILIVITGLHMPDLTEPRIVGAIAYLVVFMTIVNFLAFNLTLARMPAAWVSLNFSFAPVVGMFAAWVLLGSIIRPADLFCMSLILIGAAWPHAWRLVRWYRR